MEYFERPAGGERALLVHLELKQHGTPDEDLHEFELLAASADVTVLSIITGTRQRPDAKLYAGSGKVAEIREQVIALDIEVVLFNHALTPAQERNLERELQCRVLDRVGLILDIFAQRARTHEGKLQVELAQLDHLSSRLVRGWTHLERQGGGIGLRGPGETQLETDRRLLRNRIQLLKERLEKVRQTRAQGRAARQKAGLPSVSLVGYTNAGKSTLFNRLSGADVYAADQLFATLDPTLRRIDLDGIGPLVLADTVGFVRHLPHKLVDAFRATLEETVQADLLLHVVDASSPDLSIHLEAVTAVLTEVGATAPMLLVYNKIDALPEQQPRIDYDAQGRPQAVWLSARDNVGMAELLTAIQSCIATHWEILWLVLPVHLARLRARLYELGVVLSEDNDELGGCRLQIRIQSPDLAQWLAYEGLVRADVVVEDNPDEQLSEEC